MGKVRAYPTYKKILWRYLRVFIAAFIATISFDALITGTADVRVTVFKASLAAGLAAVAKLLREGEPYRSVIHKLPV